jgi:hypothetical protein
MNRRQFLQYTVALAAAAPFAKIALLPEAQSAPLPVVEWIPTPEQVLEWLEYYKLALKVGHTKFSDALANTFTGKPVPTKDGLGIHWTSTLEDTRAELKLFQEAERAFKALEDDRGRVGYAQGDGYALGRVGAARRTMLYTGPSNEGFAWYNGWDVGHSVLQRRGAP